MKNLLWDLNSRFNQYTPEDIDRIFNTALILSVVLLIGLLLAKSSEKENSK